MFKTRELFREYKRLTSLNLSGTNHGEPSTRPHSCTTPPGLTIHEWCQAARGRGHFCDSSYKGVSKTDILALQRGEGVQFWVISV